MNSSRRRQHDASFKAMVVLEAIRGQRTIVGEKPVNMGSIQTR